MILRPLLLGALLAVGCVPPEPIDLARHPVIGGSPDDGDPQVVSVFTVPGAPSPQLCTGTVIAPRAVLTAGHCTLGQSPDTLVVAFDASARQLVPRSVHTYPIYQGSDDNAAGIDLAILILAEDAGVPPLALLGELPASSVGRLVGFGLTDAADIQTRGRKNSALVAVAPICATLLRLGDGSSNACHGDSGGPLLFRDEAGVERVGAIASFGSDDCSPPSYGVPVAPYAGWIAAVLAGQGDGCGGACVRPAPCISDGGAPDAAIPGTPRGPGGCNAAPLGARR